MTQSLIVFHTFYNKQQLVKNKNSSREAYRAQVLLERKQKQVNLMIQFSLFSVKTPYAGRYAKSEIGVLLLSLCYT